MNVLLFKLLILGFMIVLIGLYLYIIIKNRENFDSKDSDPNTIPITTSIATTVTSSQTTQPISIQLLNQIAIQLKISVRRIQNLTYNGDISKQTLSVSFTILDPNIIETHNGETNAHTTASNANNLFTQNIFTVNINGVNIKLTKINKNTTNSVPNATLNKSSYFNNTGLEDISKYSLNKYISAPNDPSLTNFYNLKMDKNYKINPVLE
jgi:hypothetical protein